jgi:hypothetical protein
VPDLTSKAPTSTGTPLSAARLVWPDPDNLSGLWKPNGNSFIASGCKLVDQILPNVSRCRKPRTRDTRRSHYARVVCGGATGDRSSSRALFAVPSPKSTA